MKLKKSQITLIVIFIFIIIVGALYYFNYLPQEQTDTIQINESEIDTSEELETESHEDTESKDDAQSDVEQSNGDSNLEESKGIVAKEEEIQKPQIDYSYGVNFKNPFKEYRIVKKDINGDDEQLTIEAIKEMVPFTLTGIIGNSQERLAVLKYQGKTSIIKDRTVIEDFTIINILAEELVMSYKGVQFKIEMGSGIGEVL